MTRTSEYDDSKLIIIMVGLPARGKSYMSQKIARYFTWRGFNTRVFNVGQVRRALMPHNASFADLFDPNNSKHTEEREAIATHVFSSLLDWMKDEGRIGIYDATNTTIKRRQHLLDLIKSAGVMYDVIMLESICNDALIIDRNIRQNKVRQPLYANVDPEEAVNDFYTRIRHYESVYQEVQESEGVAYLKYINMGEKLQIYKINGYLPSRLVYYVMNMHTEHRVLYLCRHGESEWNAVQRIGGDKDITDRGKRFAAKLYDYIHSQKEDSLRIWSSTLKRTIETSAQLADMYPYTAFKALDEINAGVCDSMTYAEIKEKYPEIHKARKADKYNYRYPMGESYADVVDRVSPVILELERCKSSCVIVSHNAVIRVLVSYFMGLDKTQIPHLEIPLHTVIRIEDDEFRGCSTATEILLNPDDDSGPTVVSVDHGAATSWSQPTWEHMLMSPPCSPSASMQDLNLWNTAYTPERQPQRSTPIS